MTKNTPMAKRALGVYLRSGSNTYQWRLRVPQDLATLYPDTKWASRQTLGTPHLLEANRIAAGLYAGWLTKFDEQRKQLSPKPIPLTPDLITFLVDKFRHDILSKDQKSRIAGSVQGRTSEEFDESADSHHLVNSIYSEAVATGDIVAALPYLEEVANSVGIAIDENTPGYFEALAAFLVAVKVSIESTIARDRGKIVPTPPAPTLKKPEKVYYLRDVFNSWQKADGLKLTPDAVRSRELALGLFEEFTGNTPITQVTRLQGNDFKAWLQTRGAASKTSSDRLIYVNALFRYAYTELELIDRHPWERINIDSETETRRKPWTNAQITAFFAQPLYTSYALPRLQKGAGADAGYWIPLIALFSGARSSELCQLRTSDIVQDGNIWVIDINEDAEGKTVKTSASRRRVPVHSTLIKLGFLDYASTTQKAGHERLWPMLSLRIGKPSHTFSKWFNQKPRMAIPGVDIPDFHSLRHTVRTAMTAAKVSEPNQDRITGHELQGSTGTKVYAHVDLVQLREAVETIHYQGFNLSRSYSYTNI